MAEILDQQQSLSGSGVGFGQWSAVRYRGMGFQTLSAVIPDTTSYKDGDGLIVCRVYQEAV